MVTITSRYGFATQVYHDGNTDDCASAVPYGTEYTVLRYATVLHVY